MHTKKKKRLTSFGASPKRHTKKTSIAGGGESKLTFGHGKMSGPTTRLESNAAKFQAQVKAKKARDKARKKRAEARAKPKRK